MQFFRPGPVQCSGTAMLSAPANGLGREAGVAFDANRNAHPWLRSVSPVGDAPLQAGELSHKIQTGAFGNQQLPRDRRVAVLLGGESCPPGLVTLPHEIFSPPFSEYRVENLRDGISLRCGWRVRSNGPQAGRYRWAHHLHRSTRNDTFAASGDRIGLGRGKRTGQKLAHDFDACRYRRFQRGNPQVGAGAAKPSGRTGTPARRKYQRRWRKDDERALPAGSAEIGTRGRRGAATLERDVAGPQYLVENRRQDRCAQAGATLKRHCKFSLAFVGSAPTQSIIGAICPLSHDLVETEKMFLHIFAEFRRNRVIA